MPIYVCSFGHIHDLFFTRHVNCDVGGDNDVWVFSR